MGGTEQCEVLSGKSHHVYLNTDERLWKNIHHFDDEFSAFLLMLIQYIPSICTDVTCVLNVVQCLSLTNDISCTDRMDKMNFLFCFFPTEWYGWYFTVTYFHSDQVLFYKLIKSFAFNLKEFHTEFVSSWWHLFVEKSYKHSLCDR